MVSQTFAAYSVLPYPISQPTHIYRKWNPLKIFYVYLPLSQVLFEQMHFLLLAMLLQSWL